MPRDLTPDQVHLLSELYLSLPDARLKSGGRLTDISDVRAWLLELACDADPELKHIPLGINVWPHYLPTERKPLL
jgi:hypothetical protein